MLQEKKSKSKYFCKTLYSAKDCPYLDQMKEMSYVLSRDINLIWLAGHFQCKYGLYNLPLLNKAVEEFPMSASRSELFWRQWIKNGSNVSFSLGSCGEFPYTLLNFSHWLKNIFFSSASGNKENKKVFIHSNRFGSFCRCFSAKVN